MIESGAREAFISRFQVGEAYKNHCNVDPDDYQNDEATIEIYNQQKGFEIYANKIAD